MEKPTTHPLIWGNLLHLSYNMWEDHIHPDREVRGYRPFLRFDYELWEELTERMAAIGMNMVVIDLGDAIQYKSHPEISVEGAWSRKFLRKELKRLRKMGLEPIPKLNFSSCHDAWLGKYERQLSTKPYYKVCSDLIGEVVKLFDGPRFFHLGMDEETAGHQRLHEFVAIRQGDLWWHDLNFYIKKVQKAGSRPWIWADAIWRRPEEFLARMPKSVLQSNWYYGEKFNRKLHWVNGYLQLEAAGYDQVPTGSNWVTPKNFPNTVRYTQRNIDPKRLFGFLQTPWHPTLNAFRTQHLEAIESVAKVMGKDS